MKKFLFATDFSDSSQNALNYLKKLARNTDATIDLIHVYDLPVSVMSSVTYQAVEKMIQEKAKACLNKLNEMMAQLAELNRGTIHSINGMYPSTEIAQKGEEINADLIVMALRQKYSLIDRMIGSITAHTIQKSNIPVLAIPNGARYNHISQILFPTAIHATNELSEEESKALHWLYSFYQFAESPKIHMIHIKHDSEIYAEYKNNPFPSLDFIRAKANSVDEGIIQYLESNEVDLLAFYKPNRSFWERLYHSSVSRKLLFKSRVPLLVF